MSERKDETASFVLRFTQKIFKGESGEPEIQWRGNIRHVQGGGEKRFSEFDDAVEFIQGKLADLTLSAMEDKSPEEQKGILSKSYTLWKKMAKTYPKLVLETLKDPKHQVENIQTQISNVGEAISEKLEIDSWRVSSKSDHNKVMEMLEKMSTEINTLNKKVAKLSKQK